MSNRLGFRAYLKRHVTVKNLYFQPPESEKLKYPCIIYSRDSSWDRWGDNGKYLKYKGYNIIYVSRTPDDSAVDALESLPFCSYSRHYVADNLNHDVFELYF